MSRSYKKPFSVYVRHYSNKEDKVNAHRAFRAKQREELRKVVDDEDNLPNKMMDVSDIWDFNSDGKPYYHPEWVNEYKELFGWAKCFKK